jgi:hypothetical protein
VLQVWERRLKSGKSMGDGVKRSNSNTPGG